MTEYRTKPVTVEAARLTTSNYKEVLGWIRSHGKRAYHAGGEINITLTRGPFPNPAADTRIAVGHWIVKDQHGDFHGCSDAVFSDLYESPGEASK